MSHAYRLAALKLVSDLDLPELMQWDGPDDAAADIIVRLGDVPPQLEAPDYIAPVFQTKGRDAYLLSLPGTGRIQVQNGRKVTVDPDPAANQTDMRAILTGTIQAVLWHQRGLLPLHASAVALDGRAVALAGPAASGKSTLAAMLTAKGHQVAADDVCIVDVRDGDDVTVLPGTPQLRLWRDATDYLGIATECRSQVRRDKETFAVHLPSGFVRKPQKLAAVVVLHRRSNSPLSIEKLYGLSAISALRQVVHTRRAARALGRERDIFFALTRFAAAGVAIWRLRIPEDPACLQEAGAKVLSALEA